MANRSRAWKGRAIWILVLGVAASILFSAWYYQGLRVRSQKDIERVCALYAERTENLVNAFFHKTDILAAVVKLENGDITEDVFEDTAKLVYQRNSGIRGIQYMPGAVVTYSYPLKGNEAVMGKNFLQIPERKKDAQLAIDTKSIALSGPYHLIQGGLGVVARNPVFLKDGKGQEYFWGFSAIVLDLPDALKEVGLEHLAESGYDFQLYCINENQERLVIAGDENMKVENMAVGTIQVPHHAWKLALKKVNTSSERSKALVMFAAGCFLSVILWRAYCLMMREHAAVEAKDRFFSCISHDMRTPLNAVIGFASLAQKPELSDEMKNSYLQKIQASGKFLLELVNDTLMISKIGNGKLKILPRPVFTEDIGASILPAVAAMAEQKKIAFTVDSSGYRPRTILADRLNVEKILLNLLTNAVKYTPEGGSIWVTVKDVPGANADPDLVFSIRDNGIGMSKEFLSQLYEPFAQENQQGYEAYGVDLGLSIVKQLVELMGGSITVNSRKGEGTEFTVRMYLRETTDIQNRQSPTEHSPDEKLSGRKMLLCEDNKLNREIACALLRQKGVEVITAENGKIGLECFAASKPGEFDAILMDIRMPVMDGITATQAIRELERADAQTVPIIAMTADAFAEDIERCLEAGMNAHLAKPIEPQMFYRALTEHLKKRPMD